MKGFKLVPAILLSLGTAILLTGCPAVYYQPPIAIAKASPNVGEAPLSVSFDGSGSSDPDGTIVKYEWDFGDGSAVASGVTATHTFTTAGIFQVILTVTDNTGRVGRDKITINTLEATIYFASDRATPSFEIYRMNTSGGDQARVTVDPTNNDLWPNLLPQGRMEVAFASDRTGDFDIYKMTATGLLQTNLTNQSGSHEIEPSWSPDGTQIAFASNKTGNWEIFIMDADGTDITQLTTQTASVEVAPAISPDGTKIAFVSDRGGDMAIWIMDIDGTNQTKLVDSTGKDGALGPGPFATTFGFGYSTPSWSPDGTKLAFTSNRTGSVDIYVYNFATGTAAAQSGASDSGYDEFDPHWLPDGDWIAYVADSDSDGDYEIWKVNVATGAKLKLADIGANVTPAGHKA